MVMLSKNQAMGVPFMTQQLTNPARIHEDAGTIPGLTQWVKDPCVAVSCGVSCRCGSDSTLLWLWHVPVTIAPIPPLAWDPPYAMGTSLKKKKKKKKKAMSTRNVSS